MDPLHVKTQSEEVIRSLGGKVCDQLPWLERSEPRDSATAADRALALHAMLLLHFRAPAAEIAAWIAKNGLERSLSRRERQLLADGDDGLSDQDRVDLYWYIEALWAMAWAGQLIDELPIDRPVGDVLASLMPQIERGQDGAAFRKAFRLRPREELFRMLDLYYRAHWYALDGKLNSYATEPFNLDIIMERRKALEWLNDRAIADWDDAPADT